MEELHNADEHKKEITPQDKTFALFGKIMMAVIALGLVAGGAYYLGTRSSNTQPAVSPTPAPTINEPPKGAQTEVKSSGGSTITAGIAGNRFRMKTPSGWTFTTKSENGTSETIVSKGNYSLIIRQGPREAGACAYPDAPVPTNPEVGSPHVYNKYIQFSGASGEVFRRQDITANPSAGKTFYGICQKSASENFYTNYTTLGEITYEAPLNNPDGQILQEMDGMVKTLTKI